eukprot:6490891-Amphidinium_carterae.1
MRPETQAHFEAGQPESLGICLRTAAEHRRRTPTVLLCHARWALKYSSEAVHALHPQTVAGWCASASAISLTDAFVHFQRNTWFSILSKGVIAPQLKPRFGDPLDEYSSELRWNRVAQDVMRELLDVCFGCSGGVMLHSCCNKAIIDEVLPGLCVLLVQHCFPE